MSLSPVHDHGRLCKPALLKELRARIRGLESGALAKRRARDAVPLGLAAIDRALPGGGLARGTIHEVLGPASDGGGSAAAGFAAVMIARLRAASGGRVLWCRRHRGVYGPALYGPGLAAFGLEGRRLIAVTADTRTDALWTLEEALSSGGLAVVLGEVDGASPIALRRLHLAAEAKGVTAVLLRSAREHNAPSPAATRWRIAPVRSSDDAGATRFRWRVELLKCRGGIPAAEKDRGGRWEGPGEWIVEWNHGTKSGVAVAAAVRDRPAETAAEFRRAG